MTVTLLPRLEFESPGFLADPYPSYHRLRSADPVHLSSWGDWYLLRFEDVTRLTSDKGFCGRSPASANPLLHDGDAVSSFGRMAGRWMVFMDPPEHTQLRSAASAYFTKARIEGLRGRIQDLVDDILAALCDAGPVDVVAELAYRLPVTVVSDLLGMPSDDHLRFKDLLQQLTQAVDEGDIASEEEDAAAILIAYFDDLMAEKQRRPGDDFFSHLIESQARDEAFPRDLLLPTCVFLLWAGHKTTKDLIGNAILTLIRHPDQMEALRRQPEKTANAVEECLRFESPVQKICRWTKEDVAIGDKLIPENSFVVGLIGAANRDPERFEAPDSFDVDRAVGLHLAFGRGAHHCLGNALARMETQIVIRSLLDRAKQLTLEPGAPEWQEATSFRGLKRLLLTIST